MTKDRLLQANDADEDLITRSELSFRWRCHIETIKRKEKGGQLHPIRFSERMVRYRLSEVRAIEREAGVIDTQMIAAHSRSRSPKDRPLKHKERRISQPSPETERKGVIVKLEP